MLISRIIVIKHCGFVLKFKALGIVAIIALAAGFTATLAQENNALAETLSYADEMAFYSEALGISGDLAKSFGAAFSAWNARDLVQAERVFDQLDKRVSDKLVNVKAYLQLNRGLLQVDQHNYEEALAYYEQAKKLVPEWWLIDAHIAEVHALQKANSDLITSVALEPYKATFELSLKLIWLGVTGLGLGILIIQRRQRKLIGLVSMLLGCLAFALPAYRIRLPLPIQQAIPNEADASQVLDQVLSNTYRAFIFQNEEEIYDALALSVSGDVLRDIYLQNRSSVQIQAAGDATMRIDDVEIGELKELMPMEKGGFEAHASWQVSGFVRHFGHLHYRRNGYEAIIQLVPEEGVWKIKTISLLSQTQLI